MQMWHDSRVCSVGYLKRATSLLFFFKTYDGGRQSRASLPVSRKASLYLLMHERGNEVNRFVYTPHKLIFKDCLCIRQMRPHK